MPASTCSSGAATRCYWKTRWDVAYQRRRHGVPHPRLLQGDARGRRPQRRPGGLLQPRPERHLDRDLARHPLPRQPARRRRQPRRTWTRSPASTRLLPLRRERAHRPAVRPRRHRPVRRRPRRPGRTTPACGSGATPPSPTAASSTSRRASSATSGTPRPTTACARPASSSCRRRRIALGRHPRRPGQHRRPGYRDPQPLALPDRERRTGLRRRHHLLELGPQRRARELALRRADREHRHPAVHDQHVRRHGDPAGRRRRLPDLAGAEARQRVDRHTSPPRRRSTTCPRTSRRCRRSRSPAPRPTTTATPLTGDGKVAVVEVSLDGGATWRVASTTDGWAHWSYHLAADERGRLHGEARAIDDSLNVCNDRRRQRGRDRRAARHLQLLQRRRAEGTTALYNDQATDRARHALRRRPRRQR